MARPSTNSMILGADGAVSNAQDVRAFHRKRTHKGHQQRETDIKHALQRIQTAMKPIRSELGRVRYRGQSSERLAEALLLKAASARLQTERRKLWKLRGKPPTQLD